MIDLDPQSTALVLIDLQNGVLGRKLEPLPARSFSNGARRSREGFAPQARWWCWSTRRPRWKTRAVDEPSGLPKTLPRASSISLPGLAEPGDLKITKKSWGAFSVPELDLKLRERGVRTIVLGGVATQFGVESTARQAWELGYELVIVRDATTSIRLNPTKIRCGESFPG